LYDERRKSPKVEHGDLGNLGYQVLPLLCLPDRDALNEAGKNCNGINYVWQEMTRFESQLDKH
jgi:hypothetical protein